MNIYKNNAPIVSIIMAAYNRAGMIRESIESVINQSFTKWELIIADDESSDNTFEIAQEYQQNFENIRYMRHSHRGLPFTRNSGIAASAGRYITFLDTDDVYEPNHLLLRIEFMRKNPGTDLLHGGYRVIGNPFVIDKNDHSKLIHLDECYIGGTFFGKREIFIGLEGFRNISYSEDSEFMERALLQFKVIKVNFPTYIYNRQASDSICNTLI